MNSEPQRHKEHKEMNNPEVIKIISNSNLEDCQQQSIHAPGCVQSHGILFVLSEPDLTIIQLSNNVEQCLGIAPGLLLRKTLDILLDDEQIGYLKNTLVSGSLVEINPLQIKIKISNNQLYFSGYLHRHDQVLILELEPYISDSEISIVEFYRSIQSAIDKFKKGLTIKQLCHNFAQEIRRITDFDRVMIYQFDQDWNGEVIAEVKQEKMYSFLGFHFPAGDIPAIARKLFNVNTLRLIPDVNSIPVEILPLPNSPLDLSHAILRGVSPIHLEYLQNMGVGASMAIALRKDEQLWGLIACHHQTVKFIPTGGRIACQLLAKFLSIKLADAADSQDFQYQLQLQSIQQKLIESISNENNLIEGLINNNPNLLNLFNAQGASIYVNGDCHCLGQTPEKNQIEDLAEWLKTKLSDNIFYTDCLPKIYQPSEAYQDIASGILAVYLSSNQYLLWFRHEVIQTVNWAGIPSQLIEVDQQRQLHPRKSFELWKETVRGKSLPWTESEVNSAVELRESILEFGLRKANELALLNAELERSNQELDSFAYIASHDLKEPLRGIHNYANFLIEDYADKLDQEGVEQLSTITRLTQRMNDLLDSLLYFSRLGKLQLSLQNIDLNELINETIEVLIASLQNKDVKIEITNPLPEIKADRIRVSELLSNLIINGIKYNNKTEKIIEIGFINPSSFSDNLIQETNNPIIFYIRDNGIGIQQRHQEVIFQIFKRLHGKDQYGGGTGIGLTIAKKIVERHGGKIWVESVYGEGTTFYFTLSG